MASALGPRARVGCLVVRCALRVLFALHPPILEPDLDLPFGQVQVSRQFPPAK